MILTQKSDTFGAMASGLCMIHCLATPFLFVAQASVFHGADAPFWWSTLDYLFMGVSFLAVYWSTKTTGKQWMKYAMWISWGALALAIFNEKMEWVHGFGAAVYFPAVSLVILHIYNRKYCQCADDVCAAEPEEVKELS